MQYFEVTHTVVSAIAANTAEEAERLARQDIIQTLGSVEVLPEVKVTDVTLQVV